MQSRSTPAKRNINYQIKEKAEADKVHRKKRLKAEMLA
jgi:hypothetical protein